MNIQPTQIQVEINGTDLCYFEWGEANQPTLLLLHATGFHARIWDEIARKFAHDFRVIAPDFRGHGRSGNEPPFDWSQFANDIHALVVHLDLSDITVAGHSMGGHCAITIAGLNPIRYKSLLLIDPVVLSPEDMRMRVERKSEMGDTLHPVAKRRNVWDSPNQMYESFVGREPFASWNKQVLRDYCDHGLLQQPDETFALACPPAIEADVYRNSDSGDNVELISNVTQPVTVMRARRKSSRDSEIDFSSSPTWPELASKFSNGNDIFLPDSSHFIPMERPDLVETHIRAMLSFDAEGEMKVQ